MSKEIAIKAGKEFSAAHVAQLEAELAKFRMNPEDRKGRLICPAGQNFFNELYATMIDPVEPSDLGIDSLCELLLLEARKQREQLARLSEVEHELAAAKKLYELTANTFEAELADTFAWSTIESVLLMHSINERFWGSPNEYWVICECRERFSGVTISTALAGYLGHLRSIL